MTATISPPAAPSVTAQPAIKVDRLTKRYGAKAVVDGLSFSIPRGVLTGFLGPNGSGKTTTIRMIFDLVRPTSGAALVDGRPFGSLDRPATTPGFSSTGGGPGTICGSSRRNAGSRREIASAKKRTSKVPWTRQTFLDAIASAEDRQLAE